MRISWLINGLENLSIDLSVSVIFSNLFFQNFFQLFIYLFIYLFTVILYALLHDDDMSKFKLRTEHLRFAVVRLVDNISLWIILVN